MKFIYELTDDEVTILNHDLLDVEAWIKAAIVGKIENCKKRAAREYREILKLEGATMVPASDVIAIKAYFSRPDYENRAKRDEKQLKKMQKEN